MDNYVVKIKDGGGYDFYLPQTMTDIDGNSTTILVFDSTSSLVDLQSQITSII